MKRSRWLMGLWVGTMAAGPALASPVEGGIWVEGTAELRVAPDRARLSFGIEQLDASLADAEKVVREKTVALVAALRTLGVAESAIASGAQQVHPEAVWNDKTRRNELVGYRVRRDVNVTLEALDRLGAVLSAATTVGVSHVHPPVLESSRLAELRREALALAAQDAQARARSLASALGTSVGAPLEIQAAPPPPMYRPIPVVHAPMAKAADVGVEVRNEDYGVSLGEIVVPANVTVRFALGGPPPARR